MTNNNITFLVLALMTFAGLSLPLLALAFLSLGTSLKKLPAFNSIEVSIFATALLTICALVLLFFNFAT